MKKHLCLLAGVLMTAAALIAAVLWPASDVSRFDQALQATVRREALGVSESDLSAFAWETMTYLRGEKPAWEPSIRLYGLDAEASIPPSFRQHMAEVRAAASAAPWIAIVLFAAGLALWLAGGRQCKPSLAGLLALLLLVSCALVWAAADFHSLWMVLHRAFIPGGVFSAREPVMQLFPLELFFRYVVPVALSAAMHLAALAAFFYFAKPRGQKP